MSPARAQAAARADVAAPSRRRPGPTSAPAALRSADPPPRRGAGLIAGLRSGNVLGRIGTLAAVALFVSVFGVVVFQALLVQGQARLDRLNDQITVQQQQSKQLQLQVAQLEAPDRIVGRAAQLGMVDPGDVVYLAPSAQDDAKAALTAPAAPPTTAPRPHSSTQTPATPVSSAPPTRSTPTTAAAGAAKAARP